MTAERPAVIGLLHVNFIRHRAYGSRGSQTATATGPTPALLGPGQKHRQSFPNRLRVAAILVAHFMRTGRSQELGHRGIRAPAALGIDVSDTGISPYPAPTEKDAPLGHARKRVCDGKLGLCARIRELRGGRATSAFVVLNAGSKRYKTQQAGACAKRLSDGSWLWTANPAWHIRHFG